VVTDPEYDALRSALPDSVASHDSNYLSTVDGSERNSPCCGGSDAAGASVPRNGRRGSGQRPNAADLLRRERESGPLCGDASGSKRKNKTTGSFRIAAVRSEKSR